MLAQTLHKNALNGSAVDMVTYWHILSLDYWCITSSNNNSDVTKARGGEGSHILAIRVLATGKSTVFKPFSLVKGLVIIENWSSL